MPLNKKSLRRLLSLAVVFTLFQKSLPPEETLAKDLQSKEEEPEFSRIRCPLCQWQPNASSRWCCAPNEYPEYFYGGCYTSWNSFETRGLCPGCQHQWRWTICLSCHGWSLHEDWYTTKNNV